MSIDSSIRVSLTLEDEDRVVVGGEGDILYEVTTVITFVGDPNPHYYGQRLYKNGRRSQGQRLYYVAESNAHLALGATVQAEVERALAAAAPRATASA